MTLDLIDWIAIVSSVLTIVLFTINLIQYFVGRIRKIHVLANVEAREKSIKSLIQSEYNTYYNIARHCNNARRASNASNEYEIELVRKLEVVRGCADTARSNLIAFGRKHVNFEPFYEHPAYPGVEQPDEVKMGKGPSGCP